MPPQSQTELLSAYMLDAAQPGGGGSGGMLDAAGAHATVEGLLDSGASLEFTLAGRPFNASALTIVVDWDMDQV